MKDFPVIDADGHVTETTDSLRRFLKKEYHHRPLMSGESWDRTFGGALGKRNEDPQIQLADMDIDGIDIQVIYPSHLSLNAEKETDLSLDIARAYNDWLAEFCAAQPARLKGVAMVALHDIDAAIKEARRAVEELGFVGVMMPTNFSASSGSWKWRKISSHVDGISFQRIHMRRVEPVGRIGALV